MRQFVGLMSGALCCRNARVNARRASHSFHYLPRSLAMQIGEQSHFLESGLSNFDSQPFLMHSHWLLLSLLFVLLPIPVPV